MSTFVVQCLTAQCPRYTQIAEVIKLRVIITMALLLSLGGCANQTVRVYENTGKRQCEGGGVTLTENAARKAVPAMNSSNVQTPNKHSVTLAVALLFAASSVFSELPTLFEDEKFRLVGYDYSQFSRSSDKEVSNASDPGRG